MKFIILAIKAIALLMFMVGFVMCFISDILVMSVSSVIGSFLVYGFSYVVEAACIYIKSKKGTEWEIFSV